MRRVVGQKMDLDRLCVCEREKRKSIFYFTNRTGTRFKETIKEIRINVDRPTRSLVLGLVGASLTTRCLTQGPGSL